MEHKRTAVSEDMIHPQRDYKGGFSSSALGIMRTVVNDELANAHA
jgi:hypothetical protein